MRFGMDAYDPGLTAWFDNISFVKAPGISGTVVLNAPGTASPYLGEPKEIQWQVKAYTPLPDNNLLTDYPMAVDNNRVFHSSAPQGVSDIYIKGVKFLSAKYASATVGGVGTFTNLGTIQVYNGDANGDDVINTDDYLIFNNAFDTAYNDPNFDARADFNGDQVVSTDDYLILTENFGREGALITDGR